MTRIFTVPFSLAVPAAATYNQASTILTNLTSLIGAYLIFPSGTGNAMQYRFYEAPSKPTNPLIAPSGKPIGRDFIDDPFYVGDGIAYPVMWQETPADSNECIIIAVTNNSTITLNAQALVTLAQ